MDFRGLLQNKNFIYSLLGFNLLLRILAAAFTTLGNDEVYYTLYARWPDIAYFDHPPMVGWMIWLTSFGMHLKHEFFIRLGALFIGSANVYLLWLCGKLLRNQVTGNIAALLGSASFYVSVIAGVFVLPDTPQSFFWMLSVYFFLKYIFNEENKFLYFFGLTAGLALLSKYHGIYLWFGAGLYFLLYDRRKLLCPHFYLAAVLSFLIFLPVVIWNFNSPYSGLGYHEGRVGSSSLLPNFKFFFPELFGQIFYNNPFNVFLAVSALVILKKNKSEFFNSKVKFLLLVGLPLIFTTLIMAMYNKTLPHWSGPGWFSMILIAAFVFSDEKNLMLKKLSISLKGAVILFVSVIVLALFQVGTGFLLGNPNAPTEKLGKDDFTVDLSQWKRVGKALNNEIPENSVIVTHNWFPAAHVTHYFGDGKNVRVYVSGNSEKKHQYLKINKDLGEISPNDPSYYISVSHYYQKPDSLLMKDFDTLSPRKIIPILQNGHQKVNVFLWKIKAKKKLVP